MIDPDPSRRSPAEAEEIRRVIAWHLCGTMPPDDETLRELYADDVSLDSLGVDSIDAAPIACALEEKFSIKIPGPAADSWFTVGDIIRSAQSAKKTS